MSALTPIEKYLGLSAGDDPFAMLGVTPERCSQADVLAALSRRLGVIDRHPHGRSLEAEEVRLALHAAAAQLFDPVVRDHLVAAARSVGTPAPAPAAVPQPPAADVAKPQAPRPTTGPRATERVLEFQDAALRLIRVSGGWGPRAAHRVAALAHAYGLERDEVRAAFHVRRNGAARPAVEPTAGGAPAAKAARPRRKRSREGRAALVLALSAVGVGSVFVIAVALLGAALTTGGAAPENSTDSQASTRESAPTTRVEAPPTDAPADTGESRARTPLALTASQIQPALEDALAQRETDPGEAAWRVEEVVRWLQSHWTTLEAPVREQAVASVVSFVGAGAPGSAATERIIAALASVDGTAGERVRGQVFSTGALAQIAGTERAGAGAQERALRVLRGIVGPAGAPGEFADGADAGLRQWGERLTGEASALSISEAELAWQAWLESSLAIGDDSHTARALAALGLFLRNGPSPADNPVARESVMSLLASVAWPAVEGEATATPAARELLAWFDDEQVSTASLAVVTEWLATEGAPSSVSFAMVLPRSAGPESRRAYRERYARAWGESSEALQDALAAQWLEAARGALGARPVGQSAMEAAAISVRMSQLSEAAALRAARRAGEARVAIAQANAGVDWESGATESVGLRDSSPADDGQWALAYLSSPANATGRLRALSRLPDRDVGLGVVDAEVLAEAALWGTPDEVRTRAAWLLLERSEQASVVYGVFEALPRAPRTTTVSAILESLTGSALPEPTDEAWQIAARRAVVSRLLTMLAIESQHGALDAMRDALADSYARRAALVETDIAEGGGVSLGAGRATALGIETSGGAATDSAAALRRAVIGQATGAPASLAGVGDAAAIERRRQARMRVATGAAQRFLVEQAAIVEGLALLAANERPEESSAIGDVLDAFATALAEEPTVFLQVMQAERAQLQLWAIRLGESARLATGPAGTRLFAAGGGR